MSHQLFYHKGFTISYHVYGNGGEPVLTFHGFGIDGTMWADFAEALSTRFTMVCVDVIFHGSSSYPEGRTYNQPLQYQELVDIHFALMDELGHEKFWYAGYSMGGRLALGMAKHDISRAKGLLLFAPDGLVRRPWYRGLAHSKLGYRLYNYWVERPHFFDFIATAAFRLKFIDERLYTFLDGHSSSYDRRALVRAIWFSLRHIEPEPAKVLANVQKANIQLWLFLGKFDSIIKPKNVTQWVRSQENHVRYHELETGHAMIFKRTGERVLKLLEKGKGA